MLPQKKDVSVLEIWHAGFALADRPAVKWIADKDVARDMGMLQRSILHYCSPCVKGTMENTSMPLRTYMEVKHGVDLHTDNVVMNVPSICEARYFATFIDETSDHARTFHMKVKGKAAELLNLVCWVEGRAG